MKTKAFLTLLSLSLSATALRAQYTVYPVPQTQVAGTGTTSFTAEVNVVAEPSVDEPTRARLSSVLAEHGLKAVYAGEASATLSNIYIGVAASGGKADAMIEKAGLSRDVFSVPGKYDRHLVSLADDGGRARLIVVGEHTDAAFYGLASLEQMLDGGHENMPCATLYDYADLQSRGLVEGYYGYPYSVSVKKDLMRFMMRHKMNTYLYGAKSDPYHSQYWQTPYPETITAEQEQNGWLSQGMVREISETSAATKVNFIWAIHPGNSFLGSATVVDDIMRKFASMYSLGVRQFGVFVDDVSVPSSDADLALNARRLTDLQHALEARWNTPGAAPADTVKPIHFVPQIYCRTFASSADQFRRFFEALSATPEHITVYTTGYGVWSTPNSGDLNNVKQYLGRDVAWWWNYPCNDNADEQVYPLDMYANFSDMRAVNSNSRMPSTLEHGIGLASNPMQQGEVSKTPLFSVADYAWNTSGFDNRRSWEASFKAVVGAAHAAAYRRLAPYISYNDPASLETLISAYKSGGDASALGAELTEALAACREVMAFEHDADESLRLLYQDLRPWLLKLNQMFESTLAFLKAGDKNAGRAERWSAYVPQIDRVNALSSDPAYTVDALEGMGSSISVSHSNASASKRYLTPFVDYLKENALGKDFFGQRAVQSRPESFTNVEGIRLSCPTVSDGVHYLRTSGAVTLGQGDYLGLMLPQVTRIENFQLADTLRARFAVLSSTDGKVWHRVQSDARPAGEEMFVRYLVVQNESAEPRSLRLLKSVMNLTVPLATRISSASMPDGDAWQGHTADFIIDGDYDTFATLNRNQANGDSYTVTLATTVPVYDVRVCFGTTNGDYPAVSRVQVSADGKNWSSLPVKGTTTTNVSLSDRHFVKYSDNMSYCDFSGGGRSARYVRLYISSANTSKWCRLYEIEVNRQYMQDSYVAPVADASGASLPALTDGLPYTGCVQPTDSVVCRFQQLESLSGVTLYCNAAAIEGAEVAVTLDGATWIPVCRITDDMQEIDLSAYPSALAMSLRWNGGVPAVYEIVENPDPDSKPVVSRVGSLVGSSSAGQDGLRGGIYDLGGRKVSRPGAGLYIEDGRKVLRVKR